MLDKYMLKTLSSQNKDIIIITKCFLLPRVVKSVKNVRSAIKKIFYYSKYHTLSVVEMTVSNI